QLALRYILTHPAVSVVIPGAKTEKQAQENANASVRSILSDEEISYIQSI
ncbi:aldo/keto reductase, partial [Bacillus wiedmannii]